MQPQWGKSRASEAPKGARKSLDHFGEPLND